MANEWHVPYEALNPETQDMARALQSLMEELEAVDWYNQRAQVTHDESLRQILEHNRDEEKEHASMLLEWIRRRDPAFDGHLRSFVFTTGAIGDADSAPTELAPASPPAESAPAGSSELPPTEPPPVFTVGSLRHARG